MSDEHNGKPDGRAPTGPKNEDAHVVEVAEVKAHRRAISEVDDSLLITGYLRLDKDDTTVVRFCWDNLGHLVSDRLRFFELDELPYLWLEEMDGTRIIDEWFSSEHPLLGFIPLTVQENVLHAQMMAFNDDLSYWLEHPTLHDTVWDTVNFAELIQVEEYV
uniref:Uncharacterized protein n=1 Tax=viral metagenome TaxID=1070528 RepID=A0A2V0R9D2_9ZZZZ